jgi:hypothetical protein
MVNTGPRSQKERQMAAKQTTRQTKRSKKPVSARQKKYTKITPPRNSGQYFALPENEQEKWNRIVHVIAKMRSEGKSLTQASRDFNLDRRLFLARAGSTLQKTKSGRYVAKRSDRLLRVLVIPGLQGLTEVAVRGSSTASKLAAYSDAVQKFLRTGDPSSLKKFRNLKVVNEKGERIELITDLAELQRLGSAGVLSFESLYARVA